MSLIELFYRLQQEEGSEDSSMPEEGESKYEDSQVQEIYEYMSSAAFLYGIIAAGISGVVTFLWPFFSGMDWPTMHQMTPYVKAHIGPYWNVFSFWIQELIMADEDVLLMFAESCVLSMEGPFGDHWGYIGTMWMSIFNGSSSSAASSAKPSGGAVVESSTFVWQNLILAIIMTSWTSVQMIGQLYFIPKIVLSHEGLRKIIESKIPESAAETDESVEGAEEDAE